MELRDHNLNKLVAFLAVGVLGIGAGKYFEDTLEIIAEEVVIEYQADKRNRASQFGESETLLDKIGSFPFNILGGVENVFREVVYRIENPPEPVELETCETNNGLDTWLDMQSEQSGIEFFQGLEEANQTIKRRDAGWKTLAVSREVSQNHNGSLYKGPTEDERVVEINGENYILEVTRDFKVTRNFRSLSGEEEAREGTLTFELYRPEEQTALAAYIVEISEDFPTFKEGNVMPLDVYEVIDLNAPNAEFDLTVLLNAYLDSADTDSRIREATKTISKIPREKYDSSGKVCGEKITETFSGNYAGGRIVGYENRLGDFEISLVVSTGTTGPCGDSIKIHYSADNGCAEDDTRKEIVRFNHRNTISNIDPGNRFGDPGCLWSFDGQADEDGRLNKVYQGLAESNFKAKDLDGYRWEDK